MWFMGVCFFFKQKTAYEMRISDWSSDVCSSDLGGVGGFYGAKLAEAGHDVVLIARGRHLEAIREHGLSIENLSDGRVSRSAVAVTDDPASIGRADLILFAVKLWDTAAAIDMVAPIVDEETTLLSLHNGVIKDLILKATVDRKSVV